MSNISRQRILFLTNTSFCFEIILSDSSWDAADALTYKEGDLFLKRHVSVRARENFKTIELHTPVYNQNLVLFSNNNFPFNGYTLKNIYFEFIGVYYMDVSNVSTRYNLT
jgi:hypothetical protein